MNNVGNMKLYLLLALVAAAAYFMFVDKPMQKIDLPVDEISETVGQVVPELGF
jgi:hypothetical protein